MPQISIVTPCYNTGKLVKDLAASLEAQTYRDFEWCVSDDGSEEETINILRDLKESVSFSIKLQLFEKQGGNYCRNQGFSASEGRFVKFVDADDILEHDLLMEQYELANKHPGDLILSPTKVLMESGGQFTIPLDPDLKSNSLRSYLRKATFMHGGCLLPRELVEDVGGWDERLHAGQDLDFFRRVLLTDPNIQFASSFFCYRNHNQSKRISSLSEKDLKKFEGHLIALDSFQALLVKRDCLSDYSDELAQNYDVWGMKALALNIPFAKTFLERARSLSHRFRSGGRYSRCLRAVIGDRLTSKLVRSSMWKIMHRQLVKFGLWSSS